MKHKSLHEIAMSVLIRRGAPIHWYFQTLKHAVDCLRELSFDVLGNTRSKKLEVNERGSIELPCDYVDFIRIGTGCRGLVRPIGSTLSTNRLVNLDSKGNPVPYGGSGWAYGNSQGSWVYPDGRHLTDYPRATGFSIIAERKEIQLSEYYNQGGFIILDYITDGSEIDNAVQVHPYAQACIEAYCMWQLKANNRSVSPGEARIAEEEYNKQYRILRGRKNDMTPDNVRALFSRAYGKQA